jgi:20S proteasome alpha/beta subunit
MSLGIIIKAPEGIVLAAESRVTLSTPTGNGTEMLHVNFDNATKLLTFSKPNDGIGVVTYGQAAIQFRTAQTYIPEFEAVLKNEGNQKLTVLAFAQRLSEFFMSQWQQVIPSNYNGPDMTFNVAGFDDNEPYGKVYNFNIPRLPNPVEQSAPLNGIVQFGITWGGQREIVDRLVMGYDSKIFDILVKGGIINANDIGRVAPLLSQLTLAMPIQFMPLQDCVNLATLFIKTTIDAQSLTVGLRGCGGPIDVAIITRDNCLEFIKRKKIT